METRVGRRLGYASCTSVYVRTVYNIVNVRPPQCESVIIIITADLGKSPARLSPFKMWGRFALRLAREDRTHYTRAAAAAPCWRITTIICIRMKTTTRWGEKYKKKKSRSTKRSGSSDVYLHTPRGHTIERDRMCACPAGVNVSVPSAHVIFFRFALA